MRFFRSFWTKELVVVRFIRQGSDEFWLLDDSDEADESAGNAASPKAAEPLVVPARGRVGACNKLPDCGPAAPGRDDLLRLARVDPSGRVRITGVYPQPNLTSALVASLPQPATAPGVVGEAETPAWTTPELPEPAGHSPPSETTWRSKNRFPALTGKP